MILMFAVLNFCWGSITCVSTVSSKPLSPFSWGSWHRDNTQTLGVLNLWSKLIFLVILGVLIKQVIDFFLFAHDVKAMAPPLEERPHSHPLIRAPPAHSPEKPRAPCPPPENHHYHHAPGKAPFHSPEKHHYHHAPKYGKYHIPEMILSPPN